MNESLHLWHTHGLQELPRQAAILPMCALGLQSGAFQCLLCKKLGLACVSPIFLYAMGWKIAMMMMVASQTSLCWKAGGCIQLALLAVNTGAMSEGPVDHLMPSSPKIKTRRSGICEYGW